MTWLDCEHTVLKSRQSVRLHKVLTTIGRAQANDLVLDDPQVSNSHASLVRNGGHWTVAANAKSASLLVNGKKTHSHQLSSGDTIRLGGWHIVFRDGEPRGEARTADEIATLDMMESLVTLSADLMLDTTPERLFATLLQGMVRLTRAEKGFIIIFKDGQRHLAACHNVVDDQLDMTSVSDSIITQVVESLQPVIVSDAMTDTRFGRAKSVVDLKLQSVMCVPLIYQNDLLGVIYLGNDSITGLFTERDLKLLRIYASQASLVVFHALLLNQLRLENKELQSQLEKGAAGEIIGNCQPMKGAYRVIRRVAPTDLSVLVLGETGTGKELVARELHARSPRNDRPFIAINCGAIPENLLESELFGHRKGAFTGATSDKIGKVEAAEGGTLFLDEIGEMPMNLQVKLLRVLQERMIERVGEVRLRPIDIRVVAATHQDPADMIKKGQFREDLYYRLNEISVSLPPLRDRGEDVALLAQYFLTKYRQKYGVAARGFTNQALSAIKSYYWPGNVRELENRVKKALIMSDRALLNPDDLGLAAETKRHIQPLAVAQEDFKVEYIRKVLDLNNWNKAQTARDLGVDARTIFRYIEKIDE